MRSKSGWRKVVVILVITGLMLGLALGAAYGQKPATERFRGTTIRVMAINMPQIKPFWTFIPEFEEKYGMKIIVDEFPFDQLQERSLMESAQHTGSYDIISIDCMWIASYTLPGYVEPIMKYIKDPSLTDPEFDLGDFVPRQISGTGVMNDVLYNMVQSGSSCGQSIRKDLFEANGLALPKTKADWNYKYMTEAIEKLTRPEEGYYGFATHARRGMEWGFTWWFDVYAFQTPERFSKDELFGPNWEITLDHPDTVRSLEWFVGNKPFTPPGSENFGYDEVSTSYLTGRIAVAWNYGDWIAGQFENPEVSAVVGKSLHINDVTGPYGMDDPHFGSWGLSISADSKNKEAAWVFMQWLLNKPNARRAALMGAGPPRHSIYRDPVIQELQPWIKWIYEHQLHWANPDTRPMIPEWTEISEAMGLWGNRCWIGEITPEVAIKGMAKDIERIMDEGGYYDPAVKKPKQQWRNMVYYDNNPLGWK